MRVLVSGGAGYIGSHTVVQLVSAGHDVVIVDDFSNAKPSVVGRLEALTGRSIPVHAFDLADVDKTERFFATEQVDAVIHFAGFKAVGESVAKPLDYYQNNLGTTFSLLRAMERHGVYTLVFSSSATVYGADPELPMTEDLPTSATNPYGWTKVMIEQILRDVAASSERWRIAALRYFNPIGAVHGGIICTLLDSAAGCAVHSTLPRGTGYTSIEIKVNFMRGVTLESGRLTARGWVKKPGRRVAFAEAEIIDESGKIVATASSALLVFDIPS